MVKENIFLILACKGSHDDYHEEPLGYSFDGDKAMQLLARLELLRGSLQNLYHEKAHFIDKFGSSLPSIINDEDYSKFLDLFESKWSKRVISELSHSDQELISLFKFLSDVYYFPQKFKILEIEDIDSLTK